MKELRVIFKYFSNSLQQTLSNIPTALIFFVSKLIRYGMFMSFLYFLVSGISSLGGYTKEQILLFYLVFNLVDTSAQLLFREVYRFRPLIVSGDFDFVLSKPLNPLIRVLLGGPDFIDLGILAIILGLTLYMIGFVLKTSPLPIFIFSLMIINSLLIAAAFHICVLAMGILTFSIDHLIMIYRDLTSLVRIPVDLYTQPLRTIITFVVPLGIMFTFPPKVLLGLLSWQFIITSLILGTGGLLLSIKFWNYSLRHYQSASS